MTPTFTFIIPTVGRKTIRHPLQELRKQAGVEDEVLVIGTCEPVIKGLLESDPRFHFISRERAGDYGNTERMDGLAIAKGSHLWFIDDDNTIPDDAVSRVRALVAEAPAVPHVFRWRGGPVSRRLWYGTVAGPVFIAPNIPGKVGTWHPVVYGGDFWFIQTTLYRQRCVPVFHTDEICIIRPSDDANDQDSWDPE